MISVSPGVREYLLALADDEHLMGQQHTEWIGVAPFLEEDLAFSSIGQDELGHAAMIYELLAGDDDLAIDELAFGRPADEFRSCWLVEQPMTDWSDALVRHWLYDAAEQLRWQLLAGSSIPELADVAARAEREEAYHRRHGDSLLDVLLVDTDARGRLTGSLAGMVSTARGLFDPVAGETEAVDTGVVSGPLSDCLPTWEQFVAERFGVAPPPGGIPAEQGSRTVRSTHFEPLMSRMREVLDYDPQAVW